MKIYYLKKTCNPLEKPGRNLLDHRTRREAMQSIQVKRYELIKTSPFAISPQTFHSKLKHCSLANRILIHPLPHTSIPISTLNTFHHSHLAVSLDLGHSLSILLWLSACEQAGSCDIPFVGALEISSLRLRS